MGHGWADDGKAEQEAAEDGATIAHWPWHIWPKVANDGQDKLLKDQPVEGFRCCESPRSRKTIDLILDTD